MKFLAWLLAFMIFFSSFFIVSMINSRQLFLTPEKTHQLLEKTDFANQVKAVLKKDLFEAQNSEEAMSASKNISLVFDQINFQAKVDDLVSDFYSSLAVGDKFMLSIDLVDFKSALIDQVGAENSEFDTSEVSNSIPDVWKVDAGKFDWSAKVLSFIYKNYIVILLAYGMLIALFFVICLLVSHKYLKLFFWTLIIIGLLVALQRFAWIFVNPDTLFESIISQGRSGMGVLVSSFVKYFKTESQRLLLWESIFIVTPSVIGLIIVSLIPEKVGTVPLFSHKE